MTEEKIVENEKVEIERYMCESTWHKVVKLKPLEECPICKSKAYHTLLKEKDKKDDKK